MRRKKTIKKKYQLLTYLRAIAFIGVTLFHRFSHIFPGGWLAVIIFLVLAGFLTMKAADGKNNIDLKSSLANFLNKYIKIIGPVLFIMALVMGFSLVFAREIFDDSIKSIIPVALNFENIQKIIINEDYFNQLGNFNIFNHLWYISMYMQFTVIYLLIGNLTKWANDKLKMLVYLALTLVSFGLMINFAKTNNDITRVYNGIDTRFSAFGLGGFLYLFNKVYLKNIFLSKKSLKISCISLIILTILPFFFVSGKNIASYRGIFVGYTLIAGLLSLALYKYEKRYELRNSRSIGLKILGYLGDRSFFLYLWQYIIQIFSVYYFNDLNLFLAIVIELILILVLAEISYLIFKNRNASLAIIGISIIGLIGLRITSLAIGNAKEKEIAELRAEIKANEAEIKKRNKQIQKSTAKNNEPDQKVERSLNPKDVKTQTLDKFDKNKAKTGFTEKDYDDFDFSENELSYISNISITAVGDSVIINADSYIRKFIPNFYLDGEVGRDMVSGPAVLEEIKKTNGLGDIVLVSLGSNGSANTSDMEKILEIAGDRDVYFVNTSHTQSYMDFVNNSIKEFCENHDKAHMVDWRSFIKDRPDYLAKDRTHPNIPGSDSYAKLLIRKILNVNKVEP